MRRALSLTIVTLLLASMPVISRADDAVRILMLSNRADLISGGDALVEITIPDGVDPADLTIELNGVEAGEAFQVRDDGRFSGRITGLAEGENELAARLPDDSGASITITNHPIGGPVFSGAQRWPWICTTQNNGLGQAEDEFCNAPTRYDFFYRSTNPLQTGFVAYDPNDPPSDVAMTTTDEGEEVPYIVRRERGTANRGIYDIAVLFDPAQDWDGPWDAQPGWNGKVFYPFGASCGVVHTQGSPSSVLNDMALSRGFMVANSSLNVLGSNCNTVTSAESMMMLRERIIERYGFIRYTIGSGCSGGSIGQHMVANAYPGMIDGIQPACSYMDTWSTGLEVSDCHLLLMYFARNPHLWAVPIQQSAVTGHQALSSCAAWEALFVPLLDPKTGCGLPAEQQYHPENNPGGVRCTLQDYMISVVGARPEDGFARFPLDNVGVQYGLKALNSGLITPEQFVDLNENIGSLDHDFNISSERRTTDDEVLETLYRSGQINDGNQLDEVAIIDLRGTSNQEIHTDWHSYGMRARLQAANGHADNHVIWSSHVALVGDPTWSTEAFLLLDKWLAAAETDDRDVPRAQKLRENKPADAVDACFVAGQKITDMNVCRPLFPYYGSPRIAAGMPITHDIAKCALKPLDPQDYAVGFTADQWSRLEAIFPDGVCDWSKPGIDKVPSVGWMSFKDGPGGLPLGDPPISQTL